LHRFESRLGRKGLVPRGKYTGKRGRKSSKRRNKPKKCYGTTPLEDEEKRRIGRRDESGRLKKSG